MATLILSDLHLGSLTGTDLLRRPELRAPLLELAGEVDRVVLLGDVLEMRHGPVRESLAASRPFFEDLGRALGARELVLVAGNHDHGLIEPWLARRGETELPPPLGPEQLLTPAEASGAYERIAEWCAPASVSVAYPGLWVRPDVWAIHGHYLDCHLTIPTLERLSVGAMSRVLGRHPDSFSSVEHYEAAGAPVFAWRDAVARDTHTGNALNGIATVSAWRALGGAGAGARAGTSAGLQRRPQPGSRALAWLRGRALIAGFPLAVGALNRAGLGPLRPEVSPGELRRAGLAAMGEVAARLDLGEAHVVFGHTHRAGPLPGDQQGEWRGRGGARLCNAGSWTYASIFLHRAGAESPYWPGMCAMVGEEGPPSLRPLLADRTLEQIRPPRAAART